MRDLALAFVIDRDEVVGEGGFLAIRRLRMHNRRGDGSTSAGFVCDFVHRPYGQDAVVIVLWHRDATGAVQVLLREGMRPSLAFGRDPARAPLPELAGDGWLIELPAGIIERGDVGEPGLRARAAAEALEEGGFAVAPAAMVILGAGSLPSPGTVPEKYYFVAAEVDPAAQQPLPGDGSPMEEGAGTGWWSLDAAIAACVAGALADGKTELGLRRLRDHLAGAA
ncbi:MAG: NUDIX hydrolase [Myxococcales bacterium]|nr:NUDIX hydrolase [Myxococcales bacterium]MBK7198632.1 NUDIX hydrolase [Myxococcales bacterium]